MKRTLTALGFFVVFASVASAEGEGGGTKHITMHVQNNTSAVLINPTTEHDEVNVDSVQSTIDAYGPGEIKFHFKDTANKAKMYATYQIKDDDSQTVEVKYEANSDSTGYNYSCSVEAPFPSSHNDCNDKDVHYILGN